MNKLCFPVVVLLLILQHPEHLHCQSAQISLDGSFEDWAPNLAGLTDAPEANEGVDILDFQVTNDQDFLYLRLWVDDEVRITDNLVPHNLYLYLDTDGNSATGFNAAPGMGAELGVNFYTRTVYFNVDPPSQLLMNEILLRVLPTHSANEFEFAINRHVIPDGINALFQSNTVQILFREQLSGDYLPDSGKSFYYTFDDGESYPDPALPLEKENPLLIRVCAYNVNGRLPTAGLSDEFSRLFNVLQPDIIAFSEVSNTSAQAVKTQLDSWIPTGTPEGWYTLEDDYDHITASRFPFLDSWTSPDRQFPAVVDLPEPYTHELLLINAHFNCCANDAARQDQADEFIQFVLDAKTPGGLLDLPEGSPVVLAGDLNLVGWKQQLTTLLTGDIQDEAQFGADGAPDWDGSDFTDAVPIQSDKRMAYTWRNNNSSYPPGRLDFIIYSDAVAGLAKSYVLQTEVMPADRLNQYGLLQGDSQTLSDHFPLIADFAMPLPLDADNDNCPEVPNPLQEDFNNDGLGDACSDLDSDGLTDAYEIELGTNPELADTDNDGITDGAEMSLSFTDPLQEDTNANGLNDLEELMLCNQDCPEDINGDGIINTNDLLQFLAAYGGNCN